MIKKSKVLFVSLLASTLLTSLLILHAVAQEPSVETVPVGNSPTDETQPLPEDEAQKLHTPTESDIASPLDKAIHLPGINSTQAFTSTDTPIDFIDSQCLTSTITIPSSLDFADVDVGLNISHTWRNDIDLWLYAPDGTRVELFTDQDTNYDNFNVLVDDESPYNPRNTAGNDQGQLAHHDYTLPPYQYTWFSEGAHVDVNEPLSALYPGNAQGDWKLRFCDDGFGDSGTLNWWALSFSELAGPYLYDSYKSAPPLVLTGEPITYTLVITNNGGPSTGVVMTDPIPIGTTYVANSLACTRPGCAYDSGDDAITWTGLVTASEPVTVEFAISPQGLACGSEIVNTAIITDPALESGPVTLTWSTEMWDEIVEFWDFEADDGGFASTNDWEWGVPTYPSWLGAHSGSKTWATVLDGPYHNLSDFSVLTKTVDLTGYAGSAVLLSWWQYYYIPSDYDYLEVYVNGDLLYDVHYEGDVNTGGWEPQTVDISSYGGDIVEIKFQFYASAVLAWDGWYLDDIAIVACIPEERILLQPETLSGNGCPTETLVYNLDLMNTAKTPQTIDLSVSENTFPTLVKPNQVTLDWNESALVTVEVSIPSLPDGTIDEAHLLADSGTYTDGAVIETTIGNFVWEMLEPMPTARAFNAAAAANDHLYVIGGESAGGGTLYDVNEVYDPSTGSWATATSLPIPLTGGKAAAVGNNIYVLGGETNGGVYTNTTFVYDTTSGLWNFIPGISNTLGVTPANVINYGVAVVGTDIYRMGGLENPGDDDSATMWRLDTTSNTWTRVANMLYHRFNPAVGAIGGKIYVAGGAQRPGFIKMTQAEVYDPVTNTWSDGAMTDLPIPAAYAGDAVRDGKLYVIGGHWNNSWNNPTWTGIYDPESDAWLVNPGTAELNQGRFYLDADTLNGKIYAVGGRDNTDATVYNTNEIYPSSCAPDMVVAAPPLKTTLCPSSMDTITFTICNADLAPLDWSISEIPDTQWLSENPGSGTLAFNACSIVSVTFNSSGLASGDYFANLAADSNDPDADMTLPVSLTVLGPVNGVDFDWWPITPTVGSTLYFTAATPLGSPPFTYSWDFGDDSLEQNGIMVTHVYTTEGEYPVQLDVENECDKSSKVHTVTVEIGTIYYYLPLIFKND